MWSQIEPTAAHLSYLILSAFLITYALFSLFIRNRLHLSEPPLALLTGIVFGEKGADVLLPQSWGILDNLTQEFTRVIVGLQVFAVGLELPKHYIGRRPHYVVSASLAQRRPILVLMPLGVVFAMDARASNDLRLARLCSLHLGHLPDKRSHRTDHLCMLDTY